MFDIDIKKHSVPCTKDNCGTLTKLFDWICYRNNKERFATNQLICAETSRVPSKRSQKKCFASFASFRRMQAVDEVEFAWPAIS